MKIAIDVSLLSEPGSGTWSYIKYLIEHLAQVDKTNQYYLYSILTRNYRKKVTKIEIPEQSNFRFREFYCPSTFSNFSLRMSFPWAKLTRECEVVHMPAYTVLPPVKAKVVVTIHGLSCLVYPKTCTLRMRRRYSYFLTWVRQKADVVISVSEATRKDLIQLAHIPPEKIKVIRFAPSKKFRLVNGDAVIDSILKSYKIERPFILSVSVLSPIKNLGTAIYAYQRYLVKNPKSPYKFVIVGRRGWLYQEIFKIVENLGIQEKVIFVGQLAHDQLVYIYNAADLFLFVSLYEGFGIPVLEAMACGTPVITSNVSSLPEIAGDAAKLVDPYNIEDIASAMEELLNDKELRREMAEKGFEKAKCFSWEKTAKETIRVYEECRKSG